MKKSGFLFLGLLLVPFLASAAVGDIVIQEVLFNPSDKSDTGLEYIIVKNRSSENINLAGWDLYPAGIGYFNFPSFSLSSQGEVRIHLNKSGTNDSGNLYQGSVSSNMGDSSGSVALFSSIEKHDKSTIQAFIRYQRSGSSESKTWETAASDAGLWQKGDFINIDSLVAGQAIFLSNPENFKSSQGWSIKTLTEETDDDQSSQSQEQQSQSSGVSGGSSYIPPEKLPKIKAYAGKDRTVTVGASVEFRGQAFGLEDEPLDNARYLWTFGDGASKEGQNITHVYQYPGDYIAVLNVSNAPSEKYSASDYVFIKAAPNQVFISEIKTGADSFIELENKSKEEIDISGCQIKYGNQTFIFPQSTRVRSGAYLVIPSSVSGMIFYSGKGTVELLYSGGFKADSFSYNGFPSESESFNRNSASSLIGIATPAAKNSIYVANSKVSSPSENQSAISAAKNSEKSLEQENKEENNIQSANVITIGDSGGAKSNVEIYLFVVGGLILFAGVAILFIRRQSAG